MCILEIPFALPPGRFERDKPLHEGFQYENKEYIEEYECKCLDNIFYEFTCNVSIDGVQPTNDGQAAGVPPEDKLGLGKPTENPSVASVVKCDTS